MNIEVRCRKCGETSLQKVTELVAHIMKDVSSKYRRLVSAEDEDQKMKLCSAIESCEFILAKIAAIWPGTLENIEIQLNEEDKKFREARGIKEEHEN